MQAAELIQEVTMQATVRKNEERLLSEDEVTNSFIKSIEVFIFFIFSSSYISFSFSANSSLFFIFSIIFDKYL